MKPSENSQEKTTQQLPDELQQEVWGYIRKHIQQHEKASGKRVAKYEVHVSASGQLRAEVLSTQDEASAEVAAGLELDANRINDRENLSQELEAGRFQAERIAGQLDEILDLLNNGSGDVALGRIREIVRELKSPDEQQASAEPSGDNGAPEPWRIIAAHLKAAEVHIELTRLAPAADSVSKAIYVATHESQITSEAPDPQLNV